MSDTPGSFLDDVLMGMITNNRTFVSRFGRDGCSNSATDRSPPTLTPDSDYMGTLLRDATASHLLESAIRCSPNDAFAQIWEIYFSGKLSRLGIHPVANFVVTRAMERLDEKNLKSAIDETRRFISKSISV